MYPIYDIPMPDGQKVSKKNRRAGGSTMTHAERYKRWHDIADAISLAVNSIALIKTDGDLLDDIDDRTACEFITDKLIRAFTMSKTQYKKYMEVNHE